VNRVSVPFGVMKRLAILLGGGRPRCVTKRAAIRVVRRTDMEGFSVEVQAMMGDAWRPFGMLIRTPFGRGRGFRQRYKREFMPTCFAT